MNQNNLFKKIFASTSNNKRFFSFFFATASALNLVIYEKIYQYLPLKTPLLFKEKICFLKNISSILKFFLLLNPYCKIKNCHKISYINVLDKLKTVHIQAYCSDLQIIAFGCFVIQA